MIPPWVLFMEEQAVPQPITSRDFRRGYIVVGKHRRGIPLWVAIAETGCWNWLHYDFCALTYERQTAILQEVYRLQLPPGTEKWNDVPAEVIEIAAAKAMWQLAKDQGWDDQVHIRLSDLPLLEERTTDKAFKTM